MLRDFESLFPLLGYARTHTLPGTLRVLVSVFVWLAVAGLPASRWLSDPGNMGPATGQFFIALLFHGPTPGLFMEYAITASIVRKSWRTLHARGEARPFPQDAIAKCAAVGFQTWAIYAATVLVPLWFFALSAVPLLEISAFHCVAMPMTMAIPVITVYTLVGRLCPRSTCITATTAAIPVRG